MKEIKVSEVLNVTIMSATGKKWGELLKYVNEQLSCMSDDIELDFYGVQTSDAWNNEAFKQLVTNERVHMKVYTNKKLADIANLMCSMDLKSTGRVVNQDIEMSRGQTVGEKKIANMYNSFMARIEKDGTSLIDGDKYRLPVNKVISQVSTETPVRAIFKVIDTLKERSNKNYKYIIDLNGLSIVDKIQELFAEQLNVYAKNNVDVDIDADNVMSNTIYALKLVGMKEIGLEDRIRIIDKYIPVNMVGVLSKFRKTRGNNIMQRIKECNAIMARVAIYKGMNREKGLAIFDEFPKDYFFKYRDYILENDGGELDGLHCQRHVVDIMELGVEDKSIGMIYHFNRPTQEDNEDDYRTWIINKEGKLERHRVSLPVYIKGVLDDHSVMYNFDKLMEAIKETKKLCGL